ncbi:MAG: leucyl/phenylalanyl-tRNA--protein transferase [Bacteroidetes bacterium]|nr:leucyl/phenylalanyl-tRNA--protein transferase [Bacteroidota bacterium]
MSNKISFEDLFLLPTDDFVIPLKRDVSDLVAITADFTIARIKRAYSLGIFPWHKHDDLFFWYAPSPRFVIFPDKLQVSNNLVNRLNSGRYEIKMNTCFEEVMEHCATVKRNHENSTWIEDEFFDRYLQLHNEGMVQSVEVFENNELVGGLYGTIIGSVFCGESMFHLKPDTSKLALLYLCQSNMFSLIDCQLKSPHLEKLGGEFISFRKYLSFVNKKTKS